MSATWRVAGARSKYGAVTVKLDGYHFDSVAESIRYMELRLLLGQRLIDNLSVHPSYAIWINGGYICEVELDFAYDDMTQGGERIFEDVKTGKDLPMSRLKRKMFEAYYGEKVTLIKGVRR